MSSVGRKSNVIFASPATEVRLPSASYYIEKVLTKFNYFDCTPVSTPMDTSEKLMPNNGWALSQLESYRVIGCLIKTEQVFLLGGRAISWASKKQTCIIGSTMESEFMALAAAGKEAEWLSQMYNGKSRHLGVRHSMIREQIMNGMISIEFVRSEQKLADHLTKRLARDLVIKSAEGMRLKVQSSLTAEWYSSVVSGDLYYAEGYHQGVILLRIYPQRVNSSVGCFSGYASEWAS
ncbi:hypothetical protein Tco_1022972 [Tanacetum coccineum]